MTKKDYIKFAAMFKGMRSDCASYLAEEMVNIACDQTANIFAADNPNFDRARFLKACGVES